MSNRFNNVSNFASEMMGETSYLNDLLEMYQMEACVFPDEYRWILTSSDELQTDKKILLQLLWEYLDENWSYPNTYTITNPENDEYSLYILLQFVRKPLDIKKVIQKIIEYMNLFYEINRQLESNIYIVGYIIQQLEKYPTLKSEIAPKMTKNLTIYSEKVVSIFNGMVRPQLTKILEMTIEADVQFSGTYPISEKYRIQYEQWRKNIETVYIDDGRPKYIKNIGERIEELGKSDTAYSKRLDFGKIDSLYQSIRNSYTLDDTEARMYASMLKKLEMGYLDPLDCCKVLSKSNVSLFGSQNNVLKDWANHLLMEFDKVSHEEEMYDESSNKGKEEIALELKKEIVFQLTNLTNNIQEKSLATFPIRTEWENTVLAHAKELYEK